MDHLWAGWRQQYVTGVVGGASADRSARLGAVPGEGAGGPEEGLTLFEAILARSTSDAEGWIVHRGEVASVILNAYPYTNGHMLVLPNRGVAALDGLTPAEHDELWALVTRAVRCLETAYGCDGVNVGLNLGAGAGAGVPDHLHVHVLPRWAGDTNFMTTTATTRVLPEALDVSWQRLRDHWGG